MACFKYIIANTLHRGDKDNNTRKRLSLHPPCFFSLSLSLSLYIYIYIYIYISLFSNSWSRPQQPPRSQIINEKIRNSTTLQRKVLWNKMPCEQLQQEILGEFTDRTDTKRAEFTCTTELTTECNWANGSVTKTARQTQTCRSAASMSFDSLLQAKKQENNEESTIKYR